MDAGKSHLYPEVLYVIKGTKKARVARAGEYTTANYQFSRKWGPWPGHKPSSTVTPLSSSKHKVDSGTSACEGSGAFGT